MENAQKQAAVTFRTFSINDYQAVRSLWASVGGVRLRDADSKPGMKRYLERNPGTSFVAVSDGKIIGAIMAGHDGRRGYIYHLAIDKEFRSRGIGRKLVRKTIAALRQAGILKCVLEVLKKNRDGVSFWKSIGWNRRNDLVIFDRTDPDHPNA